MINDYFTSLQRANLLDNDPIPQLTLTNENYLKSYCAFLNDYLHKLCDKEHIINSPLTLKFFELEHHIDKYEEYLPFEQLRRKVTNEAFPYISDACYDTNDGLLFISTFREAPSFISSFFFSTQAPISEISFYMISTQKYGAFVLNKIFTKQFMNKITKIHFVLINSTNYFFLSYDNGSIQIYQFYTINQFEYVGLVKPHSNSIIDFGVDKNSGYIYSCAEKESSIIVSEFNYQKIILKIDIGYTINSFSFDNENRKILLSDSDGSFFIYQLSDLTKLTLLQALYNTNEYLRRPLDTIYLEDNRNCIFTSLLNQVSFYDFEEKENFQFNISKRLTLNSMNKNAAITHIRYRYVKGELILATSKGNIEFWSHCLNYPVVSIKAIANPIQKIIYDQRENVLFCIGKEMVCMFSLPMKWSSEIMRGENAKNEYSIIENNTQNKDNILLLKDAFSRLSFDIDTTNRTTNDDTNNNSISNIFNNVNLSEEIAMNEEEEDDSSLDGWEDETIE